MKRMIWLGILIGAVWVLPRLSHPAVDLGKLDPVEAIRITQDAQGVTVETDQGNTGFGETLTHALGDLRESAGSHLFLDTTENILITGTPDLGEIMNAFRPSARICITEGNVDLQAAADYLSTHKPEMTLNKLRAGEIIWQILKMNDGRGSLERSG